MPMETTRISRWLESVHVVRGARLERQDPTPEVTTMYFKDRDGLAHVVQVNPDGSPREYTDPRGHVHRYAARAAPSSQPGPLAPAAAETSRPAPAKGIAVGPGRPTAPLTADARIAATPPPPQSQRAPAIQATRPAPEAVQARAVAPVVRPQAPVAGQAREVKEARRSLEETVLEWLRDNHSLTGATIVRREIGANGIIFKLKGPDGSDYEVQTGMDQQVKGFRRV